MGSIARARFSLHSLAYCLSPVLTSAVRGCSPNLASSADPSVAAIKQLKLPNNNDDGDDEDNPKAVRTIQRPLQPLLFI